MAMQQAGGLAGWQDAYRDDDGYAPRARRGPASDYDRGGRGHLGMTTKRLSRQSRSSPSVSLYSSNMGNGQPRNGLRNDKRERTPSPAASSSYRSRARRQDDKVVGSRPWRGSGSFKSVDDSARTPARSRDSSPAASSCSERFYDDPKASPKRGHRPMRDAPRGTRGGAGGSEMSRDRKRIGQQPSGTPPRPGKPPKKSPANSESESDLLAAESRRPCQGTPPVPSSRAAQARPDFKSASPKRDVVNRSARASRDSVAEAELSRGSSPIQTARPARIPPTGTAVATSVTTVTRSPQSNFGGVTSFRAQAGSVLSSSQEQELTPLRSMRSGTGSATVAPGPAECTAEVMEVVVPRSVATLVGSVSGQPCYPQQQVLTRKARGPVARTHLVGMKRMVSSPGPMGMTSSTSGSLQSSSNSRPATRNSAGAISPPTSPPGGANAAAQLPRGVFYTRSG